MTEYFLLFCNFTLIAGDIHPSIQITRFCIQGLYRVHLILKGLTGLDWYVTNDICYVMITSVTSPSLK